MKKYKLGQKHASENLYRVIALRDFQNVKAGDVGGWVESEDNLSHDGNSWVADKAKVYGRARVSGDAVVRGSVRVYENAIIRDMADVSGHTVVSGSAVVGGTALIGGCSLISGDDRVLGASIKEYLSLLQKGG